MVTEVNIPDFMSKPKEYISMTKEEWDADRIFIAKAAWKQGWIACFQRCLCLALLIILGLSYVAWRISCLPSAEAIEFPAQIMMSHDYQH